MYSLNKVAVGAFFMAIRMKDLVVYVEGRFSVPAGTHSFSEVVHQRFLDLSSPIACASIRDLIYSL